jgi:hypothetical protein
MASVNMSSGAEVRVAVDKYLAAVPGPLICARQLWHEGLGGEGILKPRELAEVEAAIAASSGWEDAGDVRYEKFGTQKSWKRSTPTVTSNKNRLMVQHKFKVNSLYKTPEGKTLKVVLSEVYNLRCFEVDAKGNMTGPMIKIHPESELADKLTEVK